VEVIEELSARGVASAFVTNNASRTPQAVADHLVSLGVTTSVDQVVTSPQAAANILRNRFPSGTQIFVVGGNGIDAALQEAGFVPTRDPQSSCAVLVQGFGPDVGWRDLATAADLLRNRPTMVWVATNLDRTFPTPTGIAPGNGMLVAAVSEAAERAPDLVAGKPAPALLATAVERFRAGAPLMVGDRLDTDIAGASAAGMPSVFVETGVHGVHELVQAPADQRPTYIGEDLRVLVTPYPAVECDDSGARCGEARVWWGPAGIEWNDQADRIDTLRALCAWMWSQPELDSMARDAVAEAFVNHYGGSKGKGRYVGKPAHVSDHG